MDEKEIVSGNSTVALIHVQWTGLPNSWLTWENKLRLMAEYPNAPTWGQAASQGEGNVKTKDMGRDQSNPSKAQGHKEMAEQVVVTRAMPM